MKDDLSIRQKKIEDLKAVVNDVVKRHYDDGQQHIIRLDMVKKLVFAA